MIKTDQLEIWAKDMEGAITPVLSIIYKRVRKLEMGGGLWQRNHLSPMIPHIDKLLPWRRSERENSER